MITIVPDDGWNDSMTNQVAEGRTVLLKNHLCEAGLIATYDTDVFVWVDPKNSWNSLMASETLSHICTIIKAESATVNYASAAAPYIHYIQKHSKPALNLPLSICIGTRRLCVSIDSNGTLVLSDCHPLVSVRDTFNPRVAELCIKPLSYASIVREYFPGGESQLTRYLIRVFTDRTEYRSIQWLVGNCLLDPVTVSKFAILYGPGGTGKSTLITSIVSALQGVASSFSGDILSRYSKSDALPLNTLLASYRLLTCGDADLSSERLNMHVFKTITGNDTVSIPPLHVKVRCSAIIASNSLPSPSVNPDWSTAAIMRRTVVIPMLVNSMELENDIRPSTEMEQLDWIMECVHIRLTHTHIPVSVRSLLMTLLGDYYATAVTWIEIDPNATLKDCMYASALLSLHTGIPQDMLGELAKVVSPPSVTSRYGIHVIRGIRPARSL